MFCISIVPFILPRSSKSFTNIISLNPLNLRVRQVMTREIIPEVQGSLGRGRDEPSCPQTPGRVPTRLEMELWSLKHWMELYVRNNVSRGMSAATLFPTCPCMASRGSCKGKPCLGPPIWNVFGGSVDRGGILSTTECVNATSVSRQPAALGCANVSIIPKS